MIGSTISFKMILIDAYTYQQLKSHTDVSVASIDAIAQAS